MKDVKTPINERIIRYRNAAGYTQETAAAALDMKKNTYARMERYGNPHPELLVKLAELYNVDVKVLLLGETRISHKSPDNDSAQFIPMRASGHDKPIIGSPADVLTATEKSVIGGFKALKPDQKREIIELINSMRDKNKKELFEEK